MAGVLARVHDLTPRACAGERLSVVSALCPAEEAIPDGYAPFLPGAVAPRGEWRTPLLEEQFGLVGQPGIYNDADALVVSLPRVARTLAEHLGSREDFPFVQKAVRDVRFVWALEQCIGDLVPFCASPDGLVCQGPWVSFGGMRLVTHNMDLKPPLRIGFHVDNWDHRPLEHRAGGRRRLCVNLGLRPRYLLFLRTPLSELVAAGQIAVERAGELSPAALVRTWLRNNLSTLAVRLRIDPGEAYIVNADDVIHDGASDASAEPDIALHFLGHFGPP
jgi:hypothetical protein